MNCERCGSNNLVSISVQLGDDSKVEFKTCHRCESKTWTAPSGRVTLSEVLELASAHRPKY
jgi:transcription elongation factor Elf1